MITLSTCCCLKPQIIEDYEYHPNSDESADSSEPELPPEADDWEAEVDDFTPELTPPAADGPPKRFNCHIKGLPNSYSLYHKAVREYYAGVCEPGSQLLARGREEWRSDLNHWRRLSDRYVKQCGAVF